MSLIANLNSVGVSDPAGTLVRVSVSYMDDQIADPKTEFLIVASATFDVDPGITKPQLAAMVTSQGLQIIAARAKAAQFAAQYPPGTRITVG